MKDLKLRIIKKILNTEELEILQAVDELLSLGGTNIESIPDFRQAYPPSISNLEASKLQAEMDQTFGSKEEGN